MTSFAELDFLEHLLEELRPSARVRVSVPARVHYRNLSFPIHAISMGSQDPYAPTLALVGGVHGNEKIGAQVVLAYLETIAGLLQWDDTLHYQLQNFRLLFLPIVNPVGMYLLQRANGNGVDLNRNSPVEAESKPWLLGGQRFSPLLPWYRGPQGAPMETEAQVLCNFLRRELFSSRASIALDVHSGYGSVDRLWFPYAKTRQPFPLLPEVLAFKNLLDETYPNHVYRIEPQSEGYTMSGDLWDYLLDEQRATHGGVFLPLTLEMGSWAWLKKNPIQLFSSLGLFNPLMNAHRHRRVLRRHLVFFDFLQRALISPDRWAKLRSQERQDLQKQALDFWYYSG